MEKKDSEEKWLTEGPALRRSNVLVFRCSALSSPPNNLPAESLHMSYKTLQAETKLLNALLTSHGFTEVFGESNDFNLLWTGIHPKPQVFRSLASHQRLNHFPRSYELTRKDRLYKNIERMQYLKGLKHFDFVPQTFIMPAEFKELMSSHHRMKGPWIVKPVASSRGRGIYIVNTPEEVPFEESVVVAKYIDNPLLIYGHKCDLRLYVTVTSYDPLVVYLYEEGLVRFATVKYDSNENNLWNPCMHLCNYSINKHHSDYVKSDDPDAENIGHKWTLSALLRHLRSKNVDTSLLMQRIEETIIKSILSTASSIVVACNLFVPHHNNCFELYGFDLLIDDTLKPWLLEVNLSPSLACDSPLDTKVKSAVLSDLLTLVGIPAVDPLIRPQASKTIRHTSVNRSLSAELSKKRSNQGAQIGATLPNNCLTNEESKIVNSVNSQYVRRGGYIRIFPSDNSWKYYSKYLDSATGLPIQSFWKDSKKKNFNSMLYRNIYEHSSNTPTHNLEIKRYERVLTRGYTVCLQDSQEKTGNEIKDSSVDASVLKQQVIEFLKEGFKFSHIQARLIFGQYLRCVLNKMSGHEAFKFQNKESIDESNLNLIVKFLQKADDSVKLPYTKKVLNRTLACKDRVAVISKQLSDFLYQYTKETESLEDTAKTDESVPNKLFHLFLTAAQERDFEEVLLVSTQLNSSSKILLGKFNQNFKKQKPLPLFQSLGNTKQKTKGASTSAGAGQFSTS